MRLSRAEGLGRPLPVIRSKPGAVPAASRGKRSFFPMPVLAGHAPVVLVGCRRRRVVRADRRRRALVNGAIASLNWMSGFMTRDYAHLEPEPNVHDEFHMTLDDSARCQEPRLGGVTSQAAFRELLGGRSDYQDRSTRNNVAPFDIRRIAWPDSAATAPKVMDGSEFFDRRGKRAYDSRSKIN